MHDSIALKRLGEIELRLHELKLERREVLRLFQLEFNRVLERRNSLFDGLELDIEDGENCSGDELVCVFKNEEVIRGTFGYSFRSEWNTYTVELPIRYFQSDGLELMEIEAQALRERRGLQRQVQLIDELEQEKVEYLRLQAKFGDTL